MLNLAANKVGCRLNTYVTQQTIPTVDSQSHGRCLGDFLLYWPEEILPRMRNQFAQIRQGSAEHCPGAQSIENNQIHNVANPPNSTTSDLL